MTITLNGTTGITTPGLTDTGTATFSSGTANGVAYLNGSNVLTTGTALTFDGTNLGVGVTPKAWSSVTALQIQNAFVGGLNANAYLGSNAYYNGSSYIYNSSNYATLYFQSAGQHQWFNAPSGTAAGTVSFTQAMTLDASGNLGVGTSSPSTFGTLAVVGTRAYIAGGASSTEQLRLGYTDGTSYWGLGRDNVTTGNLILNNAGSTVATFSTGGNLGLGVTPSAWSLGKSFEVGNLGNGIFSAASNDFYVNEGCYYNGGWKYATTGIGVSQYELGNGVHYWNIAPSGTAGNTVSLTQAMVLDASGNLLVGTTTANSYSGYTSFQLGQQTNGSIINFQGGATSTSSAAHIRLDCSGTTVTALTIETRNQSGTSSTPIVFKTQETERARIDSSGNLLVGTTTSYGMAASSITFAGGSSVGRKIGLYSDPTIHAGMGVDLGGGPYETDLYFPYGGGSGTIRFGSISSANPGVWSERARIDTSSNLCLGVSTTTGSMDNTAILTTGSHRTYSSSAVITNATWTTIATITQPGLYIVHAYIPGYNAGPSDWSTYSIVSWTGGGPAYIWNAGGGNIQLRISSNTQIQLYSGAGTLTYAWSILRIG